MNAIGFIKFADLNVMLYRDLDDPLIRIRDIVRALNYDGSPAEIIYCCEMDEVVDNADGLFVTERGLYNILSHSDTNTGKAWRRIIFDQIIEMRRSRGMDVQEQFEEWSNNIYYDEKTGKMMCSVTVEGGDVVQEEV